MTAQTVDEVLTENVMALGGRKQSDRIKLLFTESAVEVMGMKKADGYILPSRQQPVWQPDSMK